MVVSYGSSPAAEVIFAETALDDSPTASILGADTCYRQIEFVGILAGTKNRQLAEAFVDFMLSAQFQEDLPKQMFVYPCCPLPNCPTSSSPMLNNPINLPALRPRLSPLIVTSGFRHGQIRF